MIDATTLRDYKIHSSLSRNGKWEKVFCIFARKTITGQSKRGWLYRQELDIFPHHKAPRTLYATEKEMFELRLKGKL